MPNRIIKESICRSDSIDSLSWFEEVLFYRLIVVCDDYGRFDGRAAIIKGSCFPLKDVTVKQINDSLNKLVSVGLVRVYEAQGRPYLQMSTWGKHQQIRATKSKFPSPDEACNYMISTDINKNQLNEMESNRNQLISDDCNCPRNRESINENREKNTMCKADALALFEDLWKLYPSKKGKGQVSLAAKQRLLKVGHEEMVRAIDRYMMDLEKDKEWRKPQNGSTFFNSGYVDYLDENYESGDPKDNDLPELMHSVPEQNRESAESDDVQLDEEGWVDFSSMSDDEFEKYLKKRGGTDV